jgi:inorganic triphosphatase YgiF
MAALGEASAMPVEEFARDTLRQLGRRLIEEADGIDHRAGEELHQLRIRAKKMRYAIEFFRSLFRKKAVKPMSRRSPPCRTGSARSTTRSPPRRCSTSSTANARRRIRRRAPVHAP